MIDLKKRAYPLSPGFADYLASFSRMTALPVSYTDLLRFSGAVALYDKNGDDTLWSTLSYPPSDRRDLMSGLIQTYAILRSGGDRSVMAHLEVDRVDLCLYGNSQPFRVRIINTLNENFDYFYVKRADASRLYGLELEQVLSPNDITFYADQDTLIEEHVFGIPGDLFISKYMDFNLNEVRLAKEFVKFNERCSLRLLGDMHASNFVVDVVMDFEENSYRIRPIDFDQQSYEPRRLVYLPQYYKENNPIIKLGMQYLTSESVQQYQKEERTLIKKRMRSSDFRLEALLCCMERDELAPPQNVAQLAAELAEHHRRSDFERCTSMGALVRASLDTLRP